MYFRRKRSGGHEYLQVVESQRVDGKPRQTVVATLGRLDVLRECGALDRLLRSGARLTDSAVLLSAFENGETTTLSSDRIGPAPNWRAATSTTSWASASAVRPRRRWCWLTTSPTCR